jgi:hypothetical protein
MISQIYCKSINATGRLAPIARELFASLKKQEAKNTISLY